MAYANGKLPKSLLSPIPGGELRHDAAAAWNAMDDYIFRKHGIHIRPAGPNSSNRSIAAQQAFWRIYQNGGNVAAYPGTSNHGWGIAVDVQTTTMAYYIRKYGHKFGWSHAEGARVGEWWHFTSVGGYKPKKANPLLALTREEQKWVTEYIRLKKANKNRRRRALLRRVIAKHRRAVYRKGQKYRWSKSLKTRYRLLRRYS